MIASGNFNRVHESIVYPNFIPDSMMVESWECDLFRPEQDMGSADIQKICYTEGFGPGTIDHLLFLGATYPAEQKKHPILALGSSFTDEHGVRWVPSLDSVRDENDEKKILRVLKLSEWEKVRGRRYRFLRVRRLRMKDLTPVSAG